jgi:hypothetical protein
LSATARPQEGKTICVVLVPQQDRLSAKYHGCRIALGVGKLNADFEWEPEPQQAA